MSDIKRVLVVDDEPDFAAIVQTNLEKEGFEVEVAYNGVEGLEKVYANPPDAIVLDIMMPEMDGYAVCKKLKSDEKCRCVPCNHDSLFSRRWNEHGSRRLYCQAGFGRGDN
jgi:two-component system alkaline phosphatase synthesis response regulator PhoP